MGRSPVERVVVLDITRGVLTRGEQQMCPTEPGMPFCKVPQAAEVLPGHLARVLQQSSQPFAFHWMGPVLPVADRPVEDILSKLTADLLDQLLLHGHQVARAVIVRKA